MAIDRSDAHFAPDGAKRVDALLRVSRDTPASNSDGNSRRGKGNRRAPQPHNAAVDPLDIVDISPTMSAPHEASRSPIVRPDVSDDQDAVRHLDIQV